MRKNFSMIMALMIALSTIFLSGCGNTDTEVSNELNVALTVIPLTMDPQKAGDTVSMQYINPCTESLFRLDDNNMIEPGLAQDYEVSGDGLKYTIHLRDGIVYSNGESITAKDFVFSFRRIVDPQEASQTSFFLTDTAQVKNAAEIVAGQVSAEELGVSAPDDKTLVVELEVPCPYFIYLMSIKSFSPCNESFFRKCGSNYCTSPETMLSSGPFITDKFEVLGTQTHYVKNPYYIDADKVSLSGVLFRQVSNNQQAEMLYQTGEMDIIPVERDYLVLSLDDPNLVNPSGGKISYISGNLEKSKAWANRNIRIAISKSIDRQTICSEYFRGGNHPLNRIVPENFAVEPDGTDFAKDNDRYYEVCGYDKEKARKYWEKGLEELGVSEIDMELKVFASSTDYFEIIRKQLQDNLPGLNLKLVTRESSVYLSEYFSKNFELAYFLWSADYPDPSAFLDGYVIGSSINANGYYNEEVTELLRKSKYELDPEQRMKYLHEAEDKIMYDLPNAPLFMEGSPCLISDRVKNVRIDFTGSYIICDFAKKR